MVACAPDRTTPEELAVVKQNLRRANVEVREPGPGESVAPGCHMWAPDGSSLGTVASGPHVPERIRGIISHGDLAILGGYAREDPSMLYPSLPDGTKIGWVDLVTDLIRKGFVRCKGFSMESGILLEADFSHPDAIPIVEDRLMHAYLNRGVKKGWIDDPLTGKTCNLDLDDFAENDFSLRKTLRRADCKQYEAHATRGFGCPIGMEDA